MNKILFLPILFLLLIPYSFVFGDTAINLAITGTPTSGQVPLSVQFTATPSGGTGTGYKYIWTFGDGSTSTEQNPNHIFTSVGTISVYSKLKDSAGHTFSRHIVINVLAGNSTGGGNGTGGNGTGGGNNTGTGNNSTSKCILPTAKDSYLSETFVVPDCVSNIVIEIPNEAHEGDTSNNLWISPLNHHYLATNSVISNYTSITMISDDLNHKHATVIKKGSNVIWTSTAIPASGFTTPAKVIGIVDNYTIGDPADTDLHGTLSVRNALHAPNGTTVGLVYVPQNDLQSYRNIFKTNNFNVTSEYNFTYQNTNNAVKSHTVMMYQTNQTLSNALTVIKQILDKTPYT